MGIQVWVLQVRRGRAREREGEAPHCGRALATWAPRATLHMRRTQHTPPAPHPLLRAALKAPQCSNAKGRRAPAGSRPA
eukprot:2196172-Prymnesium_polylepis.2